MSRGEPLLDAIDRAIVRATQAGLPRVREPYAQVAREVGIDESEVIARLQAMHACGALRRIAAVPDHYALGVRANGMSVWDVDDAHVGHWGRDFAALPFVSHCYHRPRHAAVWPYVLFAMVHGQTREEVHAHVARMAARVGPQLRAHEVLFSTRILKKTGLRLVG